MKWIILLFCALSFTACSPSSGTGNSENLSYDFNINNSCTGRFCKPEDNDKCRTTQSFPSQAAYCEGLKDSKLNKGCARRERKAQYFAACGPSFEDINIEGWEVSCGLADRDKSRLPLFSDRKSFCDDLFIPEHTACSTALRNELAERFECGR